MAAEPQRGPVVYLNWLAAKQNSPLRTEEFPLYSDCHVVGEAEYGPYRFLHTVPLPTPGLVQPIIVLRWDWHWEGEFPDFSRTDSEQYHGGTPPEELAALASLAVGVRFRADDSTRDFDPNGDPKGSPRAWGSRPAPSVAGITRHHHWIVPRLARGQHSLELLSPIATLPKMSPENAISLVRSARLYQDGLWICESEPELSWLLLISALETAALHWRSKKESSLLRFRTAKPELFERLSKIEDHPDIPELVAEEFKDSFGATRNFLDFVLQFRPPEPGERPLWGKIDWSQESLERILKVVYNYRSKALHSGKPFPGPMCQAPYMDPSWLTPTERPLGSSSMGGGVWLEQRHPTPTSHFRVHHQGDTSELVGFVSPSGCKTQLGGVNQSLRLGCGPSFQRKAYTHNQRQ